MMAWQKKYCSQFQFITVQWHKIFKESTHICRYKFVYIFTGHINIISTSICQNNLTLPVKTLL